MSSDTTSELFDNEHAAFGELAEHLSADQWDQPSLCSGWSIRDVVLHASFHIHRTGLRDIVGSTTARTAVAVEAAHAETPEGAVAWLQSAVPGWARRSRINLVELVVHQQDIRRPLGLDRTYSQQTLRSCLDYATTAMGNSLTLDRLRRRGRGLHLQATDLNWSTGKGPTVTGRGEALLLALGGRASALDELAGPGRSLLEQRCAAA